MRYNDSVLFVTVWNIPQPPVVVKTQPGAAVVHGLRWPVMSEAPTVSGYVSCARCDKPWVLALIAARTKGLCEECWLRSLGQRQVRSGPVAFEVSSGKRSKKKKLTDRRREMIKKRDKARLRALRRLAERYPIEFAELLAEERGHLGLDPWTIDAALQAQLQEALAS